MKESHQWIRTAKGVGKKTLALFGLCPGFQAIANWFNLFLSYVCSPQTSGNQSWQRGVLETQWRAELFQCFPCSSLKGWQNAAAVAQTQVATQVPLWAGLSTEQEPEEPYTGWGEQEQRQGKRNRRWTWSKDFLLWEIPDSRTAFQGR